MVEAMEVATQVTLCILDKVHLIAENLLLIIPFNQRINIEANNINDTDVWLYKLDQNGNIEKLWTKVDAIEGNNAIYKVCKKY